jgi:hypothetical protein
LWLEDYRFACRGGAVDDDFIIRNLPLSLANLARTWLEHLLADRIHSWSDVREIFMGKFQGTYEYPGNLWDLNDCRQRLGETLREYILLFSKECNMFPNVSNTDVIAAFLTRTTWESLVHKLGRKSPRTTKELLDIAMNHATNEEVVEMIFDRAKGKVKRDESAGEGDSNSPGNKTNKRNNGGSIVAAANQKGGRAAAGETPDHFKKML